MYLLTMAQGPSWVCRRMMTGILNLPKNLIETGKREIQEEAGYTSAKFVRQIGGFSFIYFYHQMKNNNTLARFRYLYFELQNGEQVPISKEENDKLITFWKKKDEV